MVTAPNVARGRCCGGWRAGQGALASVGALRGRSVRVSVAGCAGAGRGEGALAAVRRRPGRNWSYPEARGGVMGAVTPLLGGGADLNLRPTLCGLRLPAAATREVS